MKATHKGHCQACGRLQMLPNGKLAQHGYKITHGFFSGVCVGSKHLPFEVSCDMLPGFISNAQRALANVEATQAKLRVRPTEPKAWVANYEGTSYGRNSYVWQEVVVNGRLKTITVKDETHSWIEYFYVAPTPNGKGLGEHKIETYGMDVHNTTDHSLDVALHLNKRRAQALEKEAINLRNYIIWQQRRVDTWKPAALLPVDAKSKAGFEVKE